VAIGEAKSRSTRAMSGNRFLQAIGGGGKREPPIDGLQRTVERIIG